MGGWEIDDPLNMKYFLKLSAKALLEAFWLVKQRQQLGDHFGKYTKKIESILQKKILPKYEVSPHRLCLGTFDVPSSQGAHGIFECTRTWSRAQLAFRLIKGKATCQHNVYVNILSQSSLIAKREGDSQTAGKFSNSACRSVLSRFDVTTTLEISLMNNSGSAN